MHRYILLLTILAALYSGQSAASVHTGWVYNGLTGWAAADDDGLSDGNLGSNSNIGYRWGRFGIEVGHTYFGKFKDDTVIGGTSIDVDDKIDGWNAGLNFSRDFSDKWSGQARIGLFDWSSHGHVVIGGSQVGFRDSGNDWYAGFSIDHKWRKRSSIGFGYTYFKADNANIHLFGLHSEFRF